MSKRYTMFRHPAGKAKLENVLEFEADSDEEAKQVLEKHEPDQLKRDWMELWCGTSHKVNTRRTSFRPNGKIKR